MGSGVSVRAYLALTVGVLMRVGLKVIRYVWLREVVSKSSGFGTEKVSAGAREEVSKNGKRRVSRTMLGRLVEGVRMGNKYIGWLGKG